MESKDLERSIEMGLKVTRGAIGLSVSLAMVPVRLVLRALRPPDAEQRWEPASEPPTRSAPAAPPPEAPAPPAEAPAPPAGAPAPPAGAPAPPAAAASGDLTSADAARIREADREAATTPDSPGPEIDVEEPWEGYDQMTVTEVRRRLRGVNPTTAAMVRLYERTHKNRRGVLDVTGPS